MVSSDDIDDRGVYEISVEAQTPENYPYDALSASTVIKLEVVFSCQQDEILTLAEIAD